MRKLAMLAAASIAAFGIPGTANAQLSDNGDGTVTVSSAGSGGSAVLNFDGNVGSTPIAGLTGQLTLTFAGIVGGDYRFTYSLLNSSSVDSRISGFAFNTDPEVAGGAPGAGSVFSSLITFNAPGNQSYPNGVGAVDVCLRDGGPGNSCGGGGGGGVDEGLLAGTGSFTLDFGSGTPSTIDLSAFHVRYQSIVGIQAGTSGTGNYVPPPPPSVPEPATWAMMLMGFGATGISMRRRRKLAFAQFA